MESNKQKSENEIKYNSSLNFLNNDTNQIFINEIKDKLKQLVKVIFLVKKKLSEVHLKHNIKFF